MKTTFTGSNFSKGNTPPIYQTIGNYCLVIAALGSVLALAPISAPLAATIGAWTAFAGTLGKLLTKFTGTEECNPITDSNIPTVQSPETTK